MKIHRLLWARGRLPFLAAILGGVAWCGSAAGGFTSTVSATSVSVTGSMAGSSETINFGGLVRITSNVVTDPDFGGAPVVVLTVDFSGLTGVGAKTLKKYLTSAQIVLQRSYGTSDVIQAEVPFRLSGAAVTTKSEVAEVSLPLTFSSTGTVSALRTTVNSVLLPAAF